jgi:HlyD family secretion protein
MKKVINILIILIIVGGFIGTLFYLYQKSEETPMVAVTETPITATIINKTVATGSVVPRKEILIKPQVSGIIDKIYVEPGDKISKGELIAKVKVIPDMVALNNAENRLNRAKISYDNAKLDFDRNKKLFEDEVIAQADFQAFQIALKNANEEMNAAEENLQIIKEGASAKMGSNINTLIRSTAEGMILDVPIEEGNSVIEANTFNEGTTIALIANMGDMVFEGQVDESEVGKISEGMDLILTVGAIDNKKFNATLEYIAPKGVEENGAIQFEIKAKVNLDDSLFIRAGYSANADIVLDKVEDVVAIPEKLLKFEDQKVYVEVEIGEQEFEKRFITTGLSDGVNIQIIEGLTLEDNIKSKMVPIEEVASE